MSTPTQKFMKYTNGNVYEAGKTKKGKLVIAGNVGGVPNPQPASLPHATISAGSTAFGRFVVKTGENIASTVNKRRDMEQIQRNIVASTMAARFRNAGK